MDEPSVTNRMTSGRREKRDGSVGGVGGPVQAAAGGDSVADFGAEQISLADELGGVTGGGAGIDVARRSDLFEGAVFEEGDAIGKGHGFFLVVGDEEKRYTEFALEGF